MPACILFEEDAAWHERVVCVPTSVTPLVTPQFRYNAFESLYWTQKVGHPSGQSQSSPDWLACQSQDSAGDFCTILWALFTLLLFFTVLSRLSQSQSRAFLHGEDAFAFA